MCTYLYGCILYIIQHKFDGEKKQNLVIPYQKCVLSNETFYLSYEKNLPNYNTQFADTLNRFPDKNRAHAKS